MNAPAQNGGGLRTPENVAEGGWLVFYVDTGATEVAVSVPGFGGAFLKVGSDGRVEYRLPPGARGGENVLITDNQPPRPATATVPIVSAD